MADEISLIDLYLILVRRRWWFLGTLAVILAAVAAFLVLTRPLYESRATIQIGQVASMDGQGRPTPLEPPDALVSRLRAEYHLDSDDTATIEPPKVTDVSSGSRSHGLVTITARGYSPHQAQAFLQKTVAAIVSRQRQRFDQAMRARRSYLASMREQQKQLQSQAAAISKQLDKPGADGSDTVSALTQDRAALLQQISTNQTQLANVQESMTPPQSTPTALLHQPSLAVKRAFPKVKLTVALGIVGGVLLGLFAAFGAEFFHQAREETRRRRAAGT